MVEQLKELTVHLEYGKILIYISLAGIVFTYIMHLLFRKYGLVKYIPGLLLVSFGLYSLFNIDTSIVNVEGVNDLLMFVLGVGSGTIALLFGLILGIYNKEKKPKKDKKAK